MPSLISSCSKVIIALSCIFMSSTSIAGMIDKEGMNEWEICAMCHNLNGISRMAKFPKLAGQKPAYISKQFMDFHRGERTNDGGQMEAITTEVDLDQLDSIAGYFAQLPPPPAAELDTDAESLMRFSQGEKIFKQGLTNIPACASCHGSSGDSLTSNSQAPWLFAQHEDYLVKQLEDFQSGNRNNDATEGMHKIAKTLNAESIKSVAFYLARKAR
jgi:cytochrome c553